jgi:hypothetical protein
MAASTREAMSRVSSVSRWLRKRDTVALETPAWRATSAIVVRACTVNDVSGEAASREGMKGRRQGR